MARSFSACVVVAAVLFAAAGRTQESPIVDGGVPGGAPPAPLDPAPLDPAPLDPASQETPAPPQTPMTTPTPTTTTPTTTTPTTTTPTTPRTTPATTRVTPFEWCVHMARDGQASTAVTTCLDDIVARDPESLEATRARAGKTMLEAATTAAAIEHAPFAPPGRLELVGVAGVFGVWNAVAVGVAASSVLSVDPGPALLGTAALALAAGVGFGAGGYFLGDQLALDEGGGRLVASGLVWGTNMGIAAAIFVGDSVRPTGLETPAVYLAPIVVMGYVGGALGLAATKLGRFDAAQVSLVNSGGAMGSFLGGMVAFNLLANQVQGAGPYAFSYIAGNVAGLVGFGVLGNTLRLSWSETLIGDLGMVIGGTVIGLGTVGVMLASGSQASGQTATLIITSATSVGVVGGYAAGLGVVLATRDARGGEQAPVVSLGPVSGVVRDRGGALLPTVGLAARF